MKFSINITTSDFKVGSQRRMSVSELRCWNCDLSEQLWFGWVSSYEYRSFKSVVFGRFWILGSCLEIWIVRLISSLLCRFSVLMRDICVRSCFWILFLYYFIVLTLLWYVLVYFSVLLRDGLGSHQTTIGVKSLYMFPIVSTVYFISV